MKYLAAGTCSVPIVSRSCFPTAVHSRRTESRPPLVNWLQSALVVLIRCRQGSLMDIRLCIAVDAMGSWCATLPLGTSFEIGEQHAKDSSFSKFGPLTRVSTNEL